MQIQVSNPSKEMFSIRLGLMLMYPYIRRIWQMSTLSVKTFLKFMEAAIFVTIVPSTFLVSI